MFNHHVNNVEQLLLRAEYITTYMVGGEQIQELGEAQIALDPNGNKLHMTLQSRGLGHDLITIGCNQTEFWIVAKHNDKAWIGRAEYYPSNFANTLPGIIHPLDILRLFALQKIPDDIKPSVEGDEIFGYRYRFELPDQPNRPRASVILGATETLDVSVELTAIPPEPDAISQLWNFQSLENSSVKIPGRITFKSPILQTSMTINITKASTSNIDESVFSADTHIANISEENIIIIAEP